MKKTYCSPTTLIVMLKPVLLQSTSMGVYSNEEITSSNQILSRRRSGSWDDDGDEY